MPLPIAPIDDGGPWTLKQRQKGTKGSSAALANAYLENTVGPVQPRLFDGNLSFVTKVRVEVQIDSQSTPASDIISYTSSIFRVLQRAEPTVVIHSTDNTKSIGSPSDIPISESEFAAFFDYSQFQKKQGWKAFTYLQFVFTIAAAKSLDDIKRIPGILEELQNNKWWVTTHKFSTNTLVPVGCFVNKHCKITNPTVFAKKLETILHGSIKADASLTTSEKTTTLQDLHIDIGKRSLSMRDESNTNISSHVLEVKAEPKYAEMIKASLCSAYLQSEHDDEVEEAFIPMDWISTRPQIVCQLLVENNAFHEIMHVLPLFGINDVLMNTPFITFENSTDDTVYSIGMLIRSISGAVDPLLVEDEVPLVVALEPSFQRDDLGKWFVVARKQDISAVRDTIQTIIETHVLHSQFYADTIRDIDSLQQGISFGRDRKSTRLAQESVDMKSYSSLLASKLARIDKATSKYFKPHKKKPLRGLQIAFRSPPVPSVNTSAPPTLPSSVDTVFQPTTTSTQPSVMPVETRSDSSASLPLPVEDAVDTSASHIAWSNPVATKARVANGSVRRSVRAMGPGRGGGRSGGRMSTPHQHPSAPSVSSAMSGTSVSAYSLTSRVSEQTSPSATSTVIDSLRSEFDSKLVTMMTAQNQKFMDMMQQQSQRFENMLQLMLQTFSHSNSRASGTEPCAQLDVPLAPIQESISHSNHADNDPNRGHSSHNTAPPMAVAPDSKKASVTEPTAAVPSSKKVNVSSHNDDVFTLDSTDDTTQDSPDSSDLESSPPDSSDHDIRVKEEGTFIPVRSPRTRRRTRMAQLRHGALSPKGNTDGSVPPCG